jgi:hypothetical protein
VFIPRGAASATTPRKIAAATVTERHCRRHDRRPAVMADLGRSAANEADSIAGSGSRHLGTSLAQPSPWHLGTLAPSHPCIKRLE